MAVTSLSIDTAGNAPFHMPQPKISQVKTEIEDPHVPQLRPGTDKLVNKCLKNTYETNQAEKCQESG